MKKSGDNNEEDKIKTFHWPRMSTILLICSGAFVIWVMYMIIEKLSDKTVTADDAFLSFLLAVFSSILSILISQFYFEKQKEIGIKEIKDEYEEKTDLYVDKASEKVANLSKELWRLVAYLKGDVVSDNAGDTILIYEERARTASHIIGTLISMNNNSLSDWRGLVTEKTARIIEDRTRERRALEQQLDGIIESYYDITSEQNPDSFTGKAEDDSADIDDRISELTKKIDDITTNIIGLPISSSEKTTVVKHCIYCENEIKYRQKLSEKSKKKVKCSSCGASYNSTWSPESGFELTIISPPKKSQETSLDEAVIDEVRKRLPSQPWPTGTAINIAKELGISKKEVTGAINALVSAGVFKVQINGKIYEPVEETESVPNMETVDEVSAEVAEVAK